MFRKSVTEFGPWRLYHILARLVVAAYDKWPGIITILPDDVSLHVNTCG
jgi:hypothetical protein